jgi:hypothetical protein
MSRAYAADGNANIDTIVNDVLEWLARSDNISWLLIFDNVDLEHNPQDGDPDAYDVKRYLSGSDHGQVLITTRLAKLAQLGESRKLGKVNKEEAQAIFKSRYRSHHGKLRRIDQ